MRIRRSKKPGNPGKEMSLSGHLRELRNRILVCIVFLAAAMVAGLQFAPLLVRLLLDIGEKYGYHFVYLAPQEMLLQYFSVAFIAAVCAALPLLFYQIWAFVSPGLKKNENAFFLGAMVFGLICFCVGVFFACRLMLPFMLRFLSTLSRGSGVTAAISVQNYISFLMTIFVIFGAVFELPVLTFLLTQLGLLKVEWLRKARKVMIVVIFFVAAVITPPDVVSQVSVALPMIALYELSILICTAGQKLKRRKRKE